MGHQFGFDASVKCFLLIEYMIKLRILFFVVGFFVICKKF